jgi:hypothetical protein
MGCRMKKGENLRFFKKVGISPNLAVQGRIEAS